MEQEFKFELGQAVRLRHGYVTGYVSGRGVLTYLEGHSIITYLVVFDDKKLLVSEQELESKERSQLI